MADVLTTKLNLQSFLLRVEELYQDFIAMDLSCVNSWPEIDVIRDNLDTAKATTRNLLKDIEEDK